MNYQTEEEQFAFFDGVKAGEKAMIEEFKAMINVADSQIYVSRDLSGEEFSIVCIFRDLLRSGLEDRNKQSCRIVVPCRDGNFHGVKCLQSSDQYGFFKNDNDVRPSSCTWIEKEKAEKLYNLDVLGGVGEK